MRSRQQVLRVRFWFSRYRFVLYWVETGPNPSHLRCLNIWGGGGVSVFWVTLVRCLAGFIGGIFQGLGVVFG